MRYALDDTGQLVVAKEVRFNTRKNFDSTKVDDDGNQKVLRTGYTEKEQWNEELAHLSKADQLIDVATYDERGIAFMPVLEKDLFEAVEQEPPPEGATEYPAWCHNREAVVNTMVYDIATQLQTMHAGGHLHLDIKPENIAVDSEGDLKLVDFGLARKIDKKASGVYGTMGTPDFMAPEVFLKQFSTTQAEMWSLGATAITLLSGTYLMEEAVSAFQRKAKRDQLNKGEELKKLPTMLAFQRAHEFYAEVYNKSLHQGIFNMNLFLRNSDSKYFPSILEAYKKAPKQTLWHLSSLLAPEPENRLTTTEATASLGSSSERPKIRERSRQTLMSDHAPSRERTITQDWLEAHRSIYNPTRRS